MFLDELQAIAHDDIYLALATALHKAPSSKLVITSTAASGADTPLGRLRARALAGEVRRRGPVVDARADGLRWLSWEVPEDAELSIRRVKQANPASWITTEQLREQRQRLPETRLPRATSATSGPRRRTTGCRPGAWQACAGEPDFERRRADRGRRSTSAASGPTRRSSGSASACTSASRSSSGDRAVLEIADVVRRTRRAVHDRRVQLRPVAGAGRSARSWSSAGSGSSAFPQHDARMIPASQRLYDAIVEGRLVHRERSPSSTPTSPLRWPVTGAEGGGSTRRTGPTRSTPWSRWRWRSTGSRTARHRPGWWAGCEAALPPLRRADRRLLLPRAPAPAPARPANSRLSGAGVRRLRSPLRRLRALRRAARGPPRQRRPDRQQDPEHDPAVPRLPPIKATFPGI